MPTGKPGRNLGRRRGEDGFTIVWLAVTVTLLVAWTAATLPLWSFQIQRDKEADLIFRGMQIAEGIRVYLVRTGQYPTSFRQLVEHEPRCLRQEWANPMREDGRWGLIPVGTGGPGRSRQRGTGPDGRPIPNLNSNPSDSDPGASQEPREDGLPPGTILSAPPNEDGIGRTPQTVAFRGVYNPGGEEGTRLFLDSDVTSEWQFTVELMSALRQGTPTAPLANPRPFLAEQIGRPWPTGVTPLIAMPTAEGQGGGKPPSDGSGHVGDAARERARDDGRTAPTSGGGRG